MKVLQINSGHYRRGGADVVYLNTTDLLREKGHEVSCFSMKDEKNLPAKEENMFAENMDLRNAGAWQKIKAAPSFIHNRDAAAKLNALLTAVKPDIAHIHLYLGKLSSSILPVLRRHRVPVVFTVHDYRFICPAYLFLDGNNQVCEKCKSGFYLNCTLKKCSEGNLLQSLLLSVDAYYRKYRINPIRYAEQFIFVSDFIRQKHIEFNPAYQAKASLLYNFVPGLEKVNPVHTKGDYFLFYGRLSREKGVDTLIQAAKQAGIRLKLAGTGSLSEKYSSNPDSRIEFLGHQTGAALWKLVSQASFVLVPSEWYENNPLTILEAYGLGKPVIGSRIGGIPEIVQDGQTGFLFEPGNTNELAERLRKANDMNDTDYQRMSMSARRFANRTFDPETHYQQLIKIYTETIQAFNN